MPEQQMHCPLCNTLSRYWFYSDTRTYEVECDVCGRYRISHPLAHSLEHSRSERTASAEERALLVGASAHTRQALEPITLTTDNWQALARQHLNTPVSVKLDRLERLAARLSRFPGDNIALEASRDYPLLDASSPNEVEFLVDHLVKSGVLSGTGPLYCLTVVGWQKTRPVTMDGGVAGRAFVAMSFDPTLASPYDEGIRPALLDCGYEAVRVDRIEHNDKICDKILAEIRATEFLVADFTLQRAGVYFEAGYAMGLGRPVIWTCRDTDLGQTHFDTRQYNHIVWTTAEDLRGKLRDRIMATMLNRHAVR